MNVCKEALDKLAPLKQKYIRASNGPFMNKDITKAIMKRTRLRNNYLKIDAMQIGTHAMSKLNKLDSSKSSPNSDIPTKVIEDNIDICTPILHQEFTKSFELGKCPSEMKLADVTPVFKKDDRTNEENCRPISILSNFSKVFERCLYNQLSVFFDKILSKYQQGFRKGFIAQECLINLLEKWKQSLDQGLVFGGLLTDLSKAFGCLSYDLLVAKLVAYGVEISSVRLIMTI